MNLPSKLHERGWNLKKLLSKLHERCWNLMNLPSKLHERGWNLKKWPSKLHERCWHCQKKVLTLRWVFDILQANLSVFAMVIFGFRRTSHTECSFSTFASGRINPFWAQYFTVRMRIILQAEPSWVWNPPDYLANCTRGVDIRRIYLANCMRGVEFWRYYLANCMRGVDIVKNMY